MNYLVTGAPGSGKTTALLRLARLLGDRANGFITTEVRASGRRIGFDIEAFDGRKDVLARKSLESAFRVGPYGVDIESFERIALPAMKPIMNKILIVDEIGKMELSSAGFRKATIVALDSPVTVVAAIMRRNHTFADAVKNRPDCHILQLDRQNRDSMPERLYGLCAV